MTSPCCSDTCTRNICEWRPETDREAALFDSWKAEIEGMTTAELLASFYTVDAEKDQSA